MGFDHMELGELVGGGGEQGADDEALGLDARQALVHGDERGVVADCGRPGRLLREFAP